MDGSVEELVFQRLWEHLADQLEAWAVEHGHEVDLGVVRLALDYKRAGGDWAFARWALDDLRGFYCRWLPCAYPDRRILTQVGPTLAVFVDYLDDNGQLDAGGQTVGELRACIAGFTAGLVDLLAGPLGGLEGPEAGTLAAAGPPNGSGPGSFLMMRSCVDGLDLRDTAVAHRLLGALSLRLAEGLPLDGGEASPARAPRSLVAPVRLAAVGELAAAAAAAPAVERLRGFVSWAGNGRALTRAGNLTVADGKALAELLGTADLEAWARRRPTPPGRGPRSATELAAVQATFVWALAGGLVRIGGGRVAATALGTALASRPLELCRRALTAMLDRGGLLGTWDVDRPGEPPEWAELLDAWLACLIGMLYGWRRPVGLELLAQRAWQEVSDRVPLGGRAREANWRRVRDRLERMAARLEELGVVEREGIGAQAGLRLSPLGLWCANRMFRSEGLPAPVIGELAEADAMTLAEACAGYDDATLVAEARAWCAAHGKQAAKELADAALRARPAARLAAFRALTVIGRPAAGAVWPLLEAPRVRPFAIVWLIEHELADDRSLTRADAAMLLVESCAVFLEDSPRSAVRAFSRNGPTGRQIEQVWCISQVDSPYTAPLLQVLADLHPNELVTQAARDAARRLP